MRFAFTDEQQALRDAARSFLADHSTSEHVRTAMETDLGYDPELWRRISAELGWPAVIVPEAYGGVGLTQVELTALMEEMGRALLCSPFFATVCLGTNALLIAASEAQRAAHLPDIAAGATTATLALTDETGRLDPAHLGATARVDGSEVVLDGVTSFVIDGHSASLLVVVAREMAPADGIALYLVPGDAPGVTRRLRPTMDQTRKQADVRFDGVRVPADARLERDGWSVVQRILDLAAISLAAEQVGGAERCLDLSVEYAKERVQFGRPIGSFQAIKHKCADMLVQVESARSAAYYAGWAASVDDPELAALAALAKTYCSDAYFQCAAESIQVHGGVGFTWEYDVHLYFKRAKASEVLLGAPDHHRDRIASAIGL